MYGSEPAFSGKLDTSSSGKPFNHGGMALELDDVDIVVEASYTSARFRDVDSVLYVYPIVSKPAGKFPAEI